MGVPKLHVLFSLVICLFLQSLFVTSTYADLISRRSRRKSVDKTISVEALQKLKINISRYERLLGKCDSEQNERCGAILFDLATIQQQYQRDLYIKELDDYEELMKKWDKNPIGEEPPHPVPDYSQPIATYERLAREHPKFYTLGPITKWVTCTF